MRENAFSGLHPGVHLCYFAAVIGLTMFFMHPVFLAVSILCAGGYLWYGQGGRSLMRQVVFLLPMLLLMALLNPLFSHNGQTLLFLLPNGKAVTLESVCYGLASAGIMAGTILWFGCCNAVMTTDKITYLFGRVIPSLSLLICMTLRFLPRFRVHLQLTMEAQSAMEPPKNKLSVLKQALTAFSATVSWAMEQSIITADSMKSRGYGAGRRTAYAIFRFTRRDGFLLLILAALVLGTAVPPALGCAQWSFFPGMAGDFRSPGAMLSYLSFAGLCLLPLTIDLLEDCKWKSLRSGI